MMTSRSACVLLVLLALCACGGPDGDKLLADAGAEFATAQRQLADGSWAAARQHWRKGAAVLDANAGVEAGGKSLAQHKAEAAARMAQAMAQARSGLVKAAAKDRAGFTAVDALITECADADLRNAWNGSLRGELSGQLDVKEEEARVVAARVRNRRLARTYRLVIDAGSEEAKPLVEDWKKHVQGLLKDRLAPAELDAEAVKGEPDDLSAANTLGIVHLQLEWTLATYSPMGQEGMARPTVPESVQATLTVITRTRKTNIDGVRTWTLAETLPREFPSITGLANNSRRALLGKVSAAIERTPRLSGGDELLADAKAQVDMPPLVWGCTVSVAGQDRATVRAAGKRGYVRRAGLIREALQARFPGVAMSAGSDPRANGTVDIRVTTIEQKIPGLAEDRLDTVPVTMRVEVGIAPGPGVTASWPASQVFTAEYPVPPGTEAIFVDEQAERSITTLVGRIVREIGRQPTLDIHR